jgi:lipid-binding SYLF domain-containing protein
MEDKNMERIKIGLCGLLVILIFTGCATTAGNTPASKRQAVIDMRNTALKDLYNERPGARTKITAAPGYAVFSNFDIALFMISGGAGYGAVTPKGGKPVFMNMGQLGVGLGWGVTDFRAIFVFHDKATMNKFINEGWEFGANADAAAKAGDKGVAIGGEVVLDGITIYQLTETGLALRASVRGTKYWKDSGLN